MWVVDHLEDLESDFAVLHRVDDPLSLPGPEFFRKATRLPAYRGVMRARAEAAQERDQRSYGGTPSPTGRGAEPVQEVPLAQVLAMHPDLIERRHRRG
jgi:hypothetical protein